MPRIRTVKPQLARHEGLFELEIELGISVRFAWAIFPGSCDREGRFKWRPRDLKLDVLPYDDCDFSRVLDAWLTGGYLVKYRVGAEWYGWLPTFKAHQSLNNREAASLLPAFEDAEEKLDYRNQPLTDDLFTCDPPVDHASATRHDPARGEGKGREGEREGKKKAPNGAMSPCPIQQIFGLYQQICSNLLGAKVLNAVRERQIRARWREDPKRQDLDWWQRYFAYCNQRDWLAGKNDHDWTADIDYVTSPKGMTKIVEGAYK